MSGCKKSMTLLEFDRKSIVTVFTKRCRQDLGLRILLHVTLSPGKGQTLVGS